MTIDTLIAFAGITFLLAIVPYPNALLILHTSITTESVVHYQYFWFCGGLFHSRFYLCKGVEPFNVSVCYSVCPI